MQCFVYALVEPHTRLVRYIGKTTKGSKRYRDHLLASNLKSNTHKNHWIKSLLQTGEQPECHVLEYTQEKRLDETERWWILYAKLSLWPLTNATEGGEGSAGRVISSETRRKISESLKGRKLSEDHKEKCRVNMLGNKYTLGFKHKEQSKQAMSLKRKGVRKSAEVRTNMSKAMRATRRKWTDIELVEAVKTSTRASEVGKKLNISKTATYRLVGDVSRLGLDLAHFKGGGWAKCKS